MEELLTGRKRLEIGEGSLVQDGEWKKEDEEDGLMELHLMSHVELQELTPGSPWKAVAEEVAAQKWKPRPLEPHFGRWDKPTAAACTVDERRHSGGLEILLRSSCTAPGHRACRGTPCTDP
ncbi:unnamed protein product [Cladocopium goreaui]|uniref:Uncharacterized protein n=1 Tax=Cladocopium goreaui TaxID=2562237 RepID=A0A9P1CAK1_9DINO|nr:unnamed protein product [Cladocopium goreaui]